MKLLSLTNPVTGGLALGCVVLGGGSVHEILSPPFPPGPVALPADAGLPKSDGLQIAEQRPWTMPPAAAFAVVVERPLFTPGRRSPRDRNEHNEDAVQPVEPLALILSAVVASPDHRLALVERADGVMVLLSEGGEVDGWQLAEIHAEHVVFHADGIRQRLYLKDIPERNSLDKLDMVEAGADRRRIQGEMLSEHGGESGEGDAP